MCKLLFVSHSHRGSEPPGQMSVTGCAQRDLWALGLQDEQEELLGQAGCAQDWGLPGQVQTLLCCPCGDTVLRWGKVLLLHSPLLTLSLSRPPEFQGLALPCHVKFTLRKSLGLFCWNLQFGNICPQAGPLSKAGSRGINSHPKVLLQAQFLFSQLLLPAAGQACQGFTC